MRSDAQGRQDLAVGADTDRLLAILSIAYRRPVAASEVVAKIEAAADLWRRGEKALANLRLMYGGFGSEGDPTAGPRVALTAYLLDQGWSPSALLEELGLVHRAGGFEKYNPNHVPAGHGSQSGQFDFKSGDAIVVAQDEDDKEKEFEERDRLGEATPKEEVQHGRPITPMTGIPVIGGGGGPGGSATIDALSDVARATADKIGPGKGPVYGTRMHTEFKEQINALGREDLHSEQSHLNRERVGYGRTGSVRPDAVDGSKDRPDTAYDLKTGGAMLTPSRIKKLQSHLPLREDGTEVPIHGIRP